MFSWADLKGCSHFLLFMNLTKYANSIYPCKCFHLTEIVPHLFTILYFLIVILVICCVILCYSETKCLILTWRDLSVHRQLCFSGKRSQTVHGWLWKYNEYDQCKGKEMPCSNSLLEREWILPENISVENCCSSGSTLLMSTVGSSCEKWDF